MKKSILAHCLCFCLKKITLNKLKILPIITRGNLKYDSTHLWLEAIQIFQLARLLFCLYTDSTRQRHWQKQL